MLKKPTAFAGLTAVVAVTATSVWAQGDFTVKENCVGTRGMDSCVTTFGRPNPTPHLIFVPKSISEQETLEIQQREKRWQERCRPMIRQDAFGVPRYSYAAPGCEFGRLD